MAMMSSVRSRRLPRISKAGRQVNSTLAVPRPADAGQAAPVLSLVPRSPRSRSRPRRILPRQLGMPGWTTSCISPQVRERMFDVQRRVLPSRSYTTTVRATTRSTSRSGATSHARIFQRSTASKPPPSPPARRICARRPSWPASSLASGKSARIRAPRILRLVPSGRCVK